MLQGWRFNIFWQDGGDGGDGTGGDGTGPGGTSTSTTGGAAPGTGGVTGGGSADANAAAAASVGGQGSVGWGGGVGGTNAGTSSDGTGGSVSYASGGQASSGAGGFGGTSGIGGGTGTSAASGGGGGTAAGGAATGGGGGTAAGGSGFGVSPTLADALANAKNTNQIQTGLTANQQLQNAIASPTTVNPISMLDAYGLGQAATINTSSLAGLAAQSNSPANSVQSLSDMVSQLGYGNVGNSAPANPGLSEAAMNAVFGDALASMNGTPATAAPSSSNAVGFGNTTGVAAPDAVTSQIGLAPTLGGQVEGPAYGYSSGMTMGYPSLEGVSPGLTASPGPSPSPSQTSSLSIGPGGIGSDAVAGGTAGETAAPTATPQMRNIVVHAATQIANQIAPNAPPAVKKSIVQAVVRNMIAKTTGYYGPTTGNARGTPTYHATGN